MSYNSGLETIEVPSNEHNNAALMDLFSLRREEMRSSMKLELSRNGAPNRIQVKESHVAILREELKNFGITLH